MNLIPINKNLIVQEVKAEKKTKSGIILQKNTTPTKPELLKFKVLATSLDVENLLLTEGSFVYTVFGAGYIPIDIDGEEFIIIPEDIILAITPE